MFKQFVIGAALGLLVLTPALGQGATPQTAAQGSASSDFLQQQTGNQLRASNFIQAPVWGANNQRIGSINDLLMDQNGNVQAVVVGVGGFLGLGEKNIAIPFKNMTVMRTSDGINIDHAAVRYTKEQLNSAPNFKSTGRNP